MANRIVGSIAVVALGVLAACADRPAQSPRTASEDERKEIFLQSIRDAGYLCDRVLDVTAAESVETAWRVLCNDMLVYVASLDGDEAIHIEPIPYGDPSLPRRGVEIAPENLRREP
jgi:hypothetical protein